MSLDRAAGREAKDSNTVIAQGWKMLPEPIAIGHHSRGLSQATISERWPVSSSQSEKMRLDRFFVKALAPSFEACFHSEMIDDKELWSCALLLIKQQGERAPIYIAERIGDMALKGDVAGVETWKRIAERVGRFTLAAGTVQ